MMLDFNNLKKSKTLIVIHLQWNMFDGNVFENFTKEITLDSTNLTLYFNKGMFLRMHLILKIIKI
jgi:hypothetical protein